MATDNTNADKIALLLAPPRYKRDQFLIEEIKKYEAIYNTKSFHRKRTLRETAIQEVAATMCENGYEMTGEDMRCQVSGD